MLINKGYEVIILTRNKPGIGQSSIDNNLRRVGY